MYSKMPLPPKRKRELSDDLKQHPYVTKLDLRIKKVKHMLNSIYDVACSNLVLTDAEAGVQDFSMNYYFADKLKKLSKTIMNFANSMCDKADEIRDHTRKAEDKKVRIQPVQFIDEIHDIRDKSDVAQKKRSAKIRDFKHSTELRPKREVMSSSEDEGNEPGDPDGHFLHPKTNENPPERHSFICKFCECVFRDKNELHNHYAQHNMEYYTCMNCNRVFHTLRSFDTHQTSHNDRHICTVCKQSFKLKTTLHNHMSVHAKATLTCSHPGCPKTFKHRPNQLEHVTYGHRKTKDVPCSHCTKMFKTPTSMRAHRIVYHGYVPDITPGHPHSCKENVYTAKDNDKDKDKGKGKVSDNKKTSGSKPKCFRSKDPSKTPRKNIK